MKVIVGLSGGVDSSVSAALLRKKGYDVVGVTMKVWDGPHLTTEGRHACYGPHEIEDIEDARKVAETLKIPFYVIDLTQEYKDIVINYVKNEYFVGRTPNPCIICNRMIKFKALIEKVQELGFYFDYFVTGHYAKVEFNKSRNRYILRKAKDTTKDQSYFLFTLSQKQLSKLLLPLGEYTKEEVRKMAKEFGLHIYDKKDSQDFFYTKYSELLNAIPKQGQILDKEGKVLGTHKGIWLYTIGQRKGLGISSTKPLYVISIDREKNAVIVGYEKELYKKKLVATNLNWIAIDRLKHPINVKAKLRYTHDEAKSVVVPLKNRRVLIKFKEPQRAITPGQAVVFYKDDVVIGGGIIEKNK